MNMIKLTRVIKHSLNSQKKQKQPKQQMPKKQQQRQPWIKSHKSKQFMEYISEEQNQIPLTYWAIEAGKRQQSVKVHEDLLNLTLQRLAEADFQYHYDKEFIKNYRLGHKKQIIFILSDLKKFHYIKEQYIIDFLQTKDVEPLKKLYIDGYFSDRFFNIEKNVSLIIKHALNQDMKNIFLLNFLSEPRNLQMNKNDSQKIISIIEHFGTRKTKNLNLLRYLLTLFKMDEKNFEQYPLYFMQEMAKLSFNGCNVEKHVRNIYNFISYDTIKAIIFNLFKVNSNIQDILKNWAIVLLIFSRMAAHAEAKQQKGLNLKNIFDCCDNWYLINDIIPKVLYTESSPNNFNMYKSSLDETKKSEERKGRLQKFHENGALKINYETTDEKPISTTVWLFQKIKQNDIFNTKEGAIAKQVLQRDYTKLLNHFKYRQMFKNSEEYDDFKNVEEQTKHKFQNQNDHSLFLIKYLMGKRISSLPLIEEELSQSYFQILMNYPMREKVKKISFSKPNRQNFTKKITAKFSTKSAKEIHEQNYEAFLEKVKEIQKDKDEPDEPEEQEKPTNTFSFNFQSCEIFQDFHEQFLSKAKEINEQNLSQILEKYDKLKLAGDIFQLFKFTFFKDSLERKPLKKDILRILVNSSVGKIQKDYNKYLQNSYFLFPFPKKVYERFFQDLLTSYSRKNFKKIVTHLVLFKIQPTHKIITTLCQICKKNRNGLTLIEMMALFTKNEFTLNSNSIVKISQAFQYFENFEGDFIKFLKRYCSYTNQRFEVRFFFPYIDGKIKSSSFQSLAKLYQIIQFESKERQYEYNEELSEEENNAAEKQYKISERERVRHELYTMVQFAVDCISRQKQRDMPEFLHSLYIKWLEPVKELTIENYEVGFKLFSNNREYLESWIERFDNDNKIDKTFFFNKILQVILIFPRSYKHQLEKLLKATLYKYKYDLTIQQQELLGRIFVIIDTQGLFPQFLKYVLRHQPETNHSIKSLFYKAMNNLNDDAAKGLCLGLLDFIFNPKRQDERKTYKFIQETEEKKAEMIKQLLQQGKSAKEKIALNQKKEAKEEEVKPKQKVVEQVKVEEQVVPEKSKQREKKIKKKAKKQKKKKDEEVTEKSYSEFTEYISTQNDRSKGDLENFYTFYYTKHRERWVNTDYLNSLLLRSIDRKRNNKYENNDEQEKIRRRKH